VIKEEIAVISISGAKNIIGYCLSKGVNTKTSSFKRFKVGQQFKCLVLSFENGLCLAAPSKGKNVAENHLDLRRTVKQSLDPEIRSIEDYKLGKLTMGRIQSIKQTQINVTLGSNMKGRIHISEIVDSVSSISENIFDKFKVGQQIQAKVIGFNDAKSHKFLPFSHRNPVSQTVVELTIRPSELELMDCCLVESYDERRPTLENIKAKVEYTGFVHQVDEKYVWIHVGPKLLGRVSIFNLSLDPDVLSNVTEHFHIGSVVKCFLLSKDESKNLLDLTLISDADPLVSKDSLKIGQLLVGKVVKIQNGLMIQISPNIFAKAHITDLADEYVADILKMHTVGDYERCKVVALNEDRTQIDVSLRPSVLNEITDVQDPEITELKDLKDDSIIKGYVKNVASNGVFVSIGRNIAARVKIKDLSDSYIKDWKNLYKVGQLVKGKILSINQDNQWIDMSLKSSVVDPCSQPALKFEDLEEGMKVDGLIKAIHSYGAFIQLNGSDVSGLCHISEMSDVAVTQIDKLYEVGDPVKAIILKVDSGKRKLSLGLKASYFDDMDIEEPEQLEEDHASSVNDASDDGSDSDESDIVMQDRDAEKTEDSDLSSDDGLSDDEPLALTGFSWNETMESNEPEQKPEQVVEEPIRKSKRAKKRAKKEAEEAIARKELSLLHDESPQSADDFERLLLANPSSSYMWIKYMAFYIQMTEIENARKVAERALSTINFRDEQEKLNIWVAYLNLENSFGDSETLSQVFERATNYNDPKKAYIHLATIYDKTNKNDECDKLYKIMIKKFKTSSKVWINYSHFLAKQNMFDQIHNILNSSLKSLPKHKRKLFILIFRCEDYFIFFLA
jgi:rRNA biogenesis protein RRP5